MTYAEQPQEVKDLFEAQYGRFAEIAWNYEHTNPGRNWSGIAGIPLQRAPGTTLAPTAPPVGGGPAGTIGQSAGGYAPPAPVAAPVRLNALGNPYDEVNGGSDGISGYNAGSGPAFDFSSRNVNTITGAARWDSLTRNGQTKPTDPTLDDYKRHYQSGESFQSYYQRVKAGTDNNSIASGYSINLPDRIRAAYEAASGKPVSASEMYAASVGGGQPGGDPTLQQILAAVPFTPGMHPSNYMDQVSAAIDNNRLASGYNATRGRRLDLAREYAIEANTKAGLTPEGNPRGSGTAPGGTPPVPGTPATTAAPAPGKKRIFVSGVGMVDMTPEEEAAYNQQLQTIREGFAESSGFNRDKMAQELLMFRETQALERERMEKLGIPELAIKQRLAQLEEDKFKEQMELATRAQQFTEDMGRSNLGLEYLKFGSTLGGPQDYFAQQDFFRGAQQRGDVPVFLQALSENTQMPAFTGVGIDPGGAVTAEGLATRLTGGLQPGMNYAGGTPGTVNPNAVGERAVGSGILGGTGAQGTADKALASIGSILKAGPTQLAPQALEQLDENELALMGSGAKKLGFDWQQWMRNYAKSRVGQTALQAA